MDKMVITGFLMMAAMMLLLLGTKLKPALVFFVLPVLAGILVGFPADDMLNYITLGLKTVLPIAVMFGCAILFFGLLEEAGLFVWLTGILKSRMRSDVRSVMVLTVLISIIAHLSGSGAVSYLIVSNACRQAYVNSRIPVVKLMCLCSLTFGVMNMTPWGGPCGRLAAVLDVSPAEIWIRCIPAQLFGLILVFLIALIMSGKAVPPCRGQMPDQAEQMGKEERKSAATSRSADAVKAVLPERLVPNVLSLTAVLAALICIPIQPFIIFGTGALLVMGINYKGAEHLIQITGKCLKQAFPMMITVTATGVLTGVFTQSPLLHSMTLFFESLLPSFAAEHAHVILGFFSNPISWFVSGEVQIFGLVPITARLVQTTGITAASAGAAFLIPYSAVVFVLPTTISVHLGLAMCEVTLREHVKETYKWTLLLSAGMLVFSILTGAVPF